MILLLFALLQDVPKEVCHVELAGLEVANALLANGLTAEGVLVNRSPSEIGDVSLEVTLYAENGVACRTMPKATWTKILPRKGISVSVKDRPLESIPRFTFRVKVTYRIEGQERTFEWDGLALRFGKPYEDTEPGTKLGLAGIRAIQGEYKTVNKKQVYSGDTLFLRIRVEGLEEKARPEGMLEVTLTYDGKKQGTLKRQIQAGHWKLDAKNLPANDADPKIICYDAPWKQLIVGLCKIDDESKSSKLGVEVKFTWKKRSWTWTGLESPFYEAARPADAQ